jgi:HEPN domain-containing protein
MTSSPQGPDKLARSADAWLRQAQRDLEAARFGATGDFHALACFLSQQSAEKAVSAFLFSRGAERVWGNALADLCEDALAFDTGFEVIKSAAVLLDKHYLGARYPSALPGGVPAEAYDLEDSERAMAIAHEVVEFVRARMASPGRNKD